MWSRLRAVVAGIAEQAVEVPGLDPVAAVTGLASSAGDAASGVVAELGASESVGSVTDLAGTGAPNELAAEASEATAGAGTVVSDAVGEASTTGGGFLDALKGELAP